MKPQRRRRKANLTRIFQTSQEDFQEESQHKEKTEKYHWFGKRSLVTLS